MKLGCSFDCASMGEIRHIENSNLKRDCNEIIFANPIKMPSHLEYAYNIEVNTMTADCPEEIYKIKKYHKNAEVLLRIAVDESHSICKFNSKFGLNPTRDNLENFFDSFKNSDKADNVKLVGVSFHVGSGCMSAYSYSDAIKKSKYVFQTALEKGVKMEVLDIGGGFVQTYPLLDEVSKTLEASLNIWKGENIIYPKRIIAEPGRFLSKNVFDLFVKIIGKKKEGDIIKYYINDGLYGSFNCKIFDHSTFKFDIFRDNNIDSDPICIDKNEWMKEKRYKSIIFGATCDSIDVIIENIDIPEIEIGDYLRFNHMGAYTLAASSKFNGIPTSLVWVDNQ